ncbi:MAG TPA: nicotinamidase [bacterium]
MSPIRPDDALVIVDVQRDFCPGGALPVAGGDAVVPVLNRWIGEAVRGGAAVVATQDWHPPGHCSFASEGGPWPEHCLMRSPGAALHPDLALPPDAHVVRKGARRDRDAYSAFDGTGFGDWLRAHRIRRLWIGGLAADVCVRATVLDARREGFEVRVLAEATRPVEAEAGRRAIEDMRAAGARIEGGPG